MMNNRQDAAAFLSDMAKVRRAGIAYAGDADGVASAVIASKIIERLAGVRVSAKPPARGADAHSRSTREAFLREGIEMLLVAGTGSRPGEILPGVPTMVVDYHLPAGLPDVEVFVDLYGEQPGRSPAMALYELGAGMMDVSDLDWVAAAGGVSAVGRRSEHPLIRSAFRAHGREDIVAVSVLANAGYRHATYNPELSFEVLAHALSARDVTRHAVTGALELERMRREVQDEL